jgi:hypothetical protein
LCGQCRQARWVHDCIYPLDHKFQDPPVLGVGATDPPCRCGQPKWMHTAYWAQTTGDDHEFVPKEENP